MQTRRPRTFCFLAFSGKSSQKALLASEEMPGLPQATSVVSSVEMEKPKEHWGLYNSVLYFGPCPKSTGSYTTHRKLILIRSLRSPSPKPQLTNGETVAPAGRGQDKAESKNVGLSLLWALVVQGCESQLGTGILGGAFSLWESLLLPFFYLFFLTPASTHSPPPHFFPLTLFLFSRSRL